MDANTIAIAQSFYHSLPQAVFQTDSLLKNFKRSVAFDQGPLLSNDILDLCRICSGDIEASVKAASTGKYYEYWTVDKVLPLIEF